MTDAPARLAGIEVTAFRPEEPTHTETVQAELLRHGPALRAAQLPVETYWEARITLADGEISGLGDSTWAALCSARVQLESRRCLRLAIAAARRDCVVINVERRRGVTTVSSLADGAVHGMLAPAAVELVGTVEEQEHRYEVWQQEQRREVSQ